MADVNPQIVITAKDEASKVLKSFSKTAEDTGNSIKKFFSENMKEAGLASAALLTSLGLLSAGVIKVGSDMQQARISFETMLGSSEKAGKTLKELGDFAAKTPFDLPQVIEGSKRLLAYGITAENIIPTFKMLGDISAGVGKDKLPQLTLAFGQVKAATKLTGAELRQFSEAGVPLLQILADQAGKSVGEIQEAISNGQIKFEAVEKALMSMTQEGGKFFDLMAKQSKTFDGVLSNTRDEFVRFSLSVLGFTQEGEIRQGSIFYYLQIASEKLLKALQEIRPVAVQFMDVFLKNKDALTIFAGSLSGLVVLALIAFTIAMGKAILIMTIFSTVGGAVALLAKKFVENFPAMQEAVKGAVDVMVVKFNEFKTFIEGIPNAVSVFIEQTKARIVQFFEKDIPYSIGFLIGYATTALPIFFAQLLEWFAQTFSNGVQAFANFKQQVSLKVSETGQSIVTEISTWPSRFANFLQGLPGTVAQIFENVKIATVGKMQDIFNGISDIWNKIKDIFGSIKEKAKETINFVKEGFSAGQSAGLGAGRATGGIVPGSIGSPQLVLAHGGEEIKPYRESRGVGGSSQLSLNVYVGMYAGSETEKRNIASEIYKSLVTLAGSQNKAVAEYFGG